VTAHPGEGREVSGIGWPQRLWIPTYRLLSPDLSSGIDGRERRLRAPFLFCTAISVTAGLFANTPLDSNIVPELGSGFDCQQLIDCPDKWTYGIVYER
tara:strand:- start:1580 stop:1873 length:294 start_codon:yes stop_codon:yes gene_type:complete